jgi:hypothetical protein
MLFLAPTFFIGEVVRKTNHEVAGSIDLERLDRLLDVWERVSLSENQLVRLCISDLTVVHPLDLHPDQIAVFRLAFLQRLPGPFLLPEPSQDLLEFVLQAVDRGPFNLEPAEPRELDFRTYVEGNREREITVWLVLHVAHFAFGNRVEFLLAEWGLSAKELEGQAMSPVNHAYTDFLTAVAYEKSFQLGLASILPCFWVYLEVGKELLRRGSPDKTYQRWIDTYSSEEYERAVRQVVELMDRAAGEMVDSLRKEAKRLFRLFQTLPPFGTSPFRGCSGRWSHRCAFF